MRWFLGCLLCVGCGSGVPAVAIPVSAGFAERMVLMGQFSHAPTATEARALARQNDAREEDVDLGAEEGSEADPTSTSDAAVTNEPVVTKDASDPMSEGPDAGP